MATFIVWVCAALVGYRMAESRDRDPFWGVIGGLMFGWFCPLYYLIFIRKPKQPTLPY